MDSSSSSLLEVQPSSNLELLLESGTSMLELKNKTKKHVAFQVESINNNKYSIQPNKGVIRPESTKSITITMVAQDDKSEVCCGEDKFRVESILALYGVRDANTVAPHSSVKKARRIIEETVLGVVCVPANPPFWVPVEPQEESPPSSSLTENVKHPSEVKIEEFARKEEEPNASRNLLLMSIIGVLGVWVVYFIVKKASS